MNRSLLFIVALAAFSPLIVGCGDPPEPPLALPFEEDPVYEPTFDTPDGEACEEDGDCISGECLQDSRWPGGFCTTRGCASDAECAGDGDQICLGHPYQGAICVEGCSLSNPETCRAGYQCQPIDDQKGWCGPPNSIPTANSHPFEIHCADTFNGTAMIPYTIGESTTSYMVVPHTQGDTWIQPTRINTPSGYINFADTNRFQISMFAYYGLNPVLVPAAPYLEDQFETGDHIFQVRSNSSSVCLWVIESEGPPTEIDVNLYVVGLEGKGLTAMTAPTHRNLQAVLASAEEILSQAGISLGTVRYREIPPSAASRYSTIRSDQDIAAILTFTEYPGPSESDATSLNVMLTERFTYGPLGVSMGAPGAAGVHGEWYSGVVVSTEYMGVGGGQGNEYTAVTFAHELGHFLGLEHTSEQGGETFDYLPDTPECTSYDNRRPWNCPDWGNLMFPLADADNRDLSNGQSFVIQSNPLTRP